MPSLRGALSNIPNFLPPLMYRRVTVTSAQWLSLLGSPVVIIPAIPNKFIVADGIQYIVKLPGTPYNSAAVTSLQGTVTGASSWINIPVANLAGFTDVSTQSISISNYPRTSNPIVVLGGSWVLTTVGGDFTAGTGDFIVWVSYRVYDLANLAWF